MTQKLQSNISHRRGVSYVKLAGVVDEDNQLGELVDQIGAGTVVIDLAEVERINSCGVRDWVNWLGRVEAKPAKVVLVECSPPIVAQINLVTNFVGGGTIKSFYAPYFCAECNQEKVLLVDVADVAGARTGEVDPPTCRCDDCDLVMDFDDLPDSYFAFLRGPSPRLAGGDELDSVLREFAATGDRGKVRARTSSPNLSTAHGTSPGAGAGAGAGVPSLQSIARVATAAPSRAPSPTALELAGASAVAPAPAGARPASNPRPVTAVPVGARPTTVPPPAARPAPVVQTAPTARTSGSSKLLLVIMATALVASTALLIYLLVA